MPFYTHTPIVMPSHDSRRRTIYDYAKALLSSRYAERGILAIVLLAAFHETLFAAVGSAAALASQHWRLLAGVFGGLLVLAGVAGLIHLRRTAPASQGSAGSGGEGGEESPTTAKPAKDIVNHFSGVGGQRTLWMFAASILMACLAIYVTHYTSAVAADFATPAVDLARAVFAVFLLLPVINWTLLYEYDLFAELVKKRNVPLGLFLLGICYIVGRIFG